MRTRDLRRGAPRAVPARALPATSAAPWRRRTARPNGAGPIGDFVADIPLEPDHPSRPALDAVASGLADLASVPALLLWGPRDPVFTERYLEDLLRPAAAGRRAAVHGRVASGHRGPARRPPTTPGAGCRTGSSATRPARPRTRAGGADARAGADRPAGRTRRRPSPSCAPARSATTSFAELDQRVRDLAAGPAAAGVRAGDRVALLVPPGLDLTVAVYACWRVGAVIVVADAGLGLRGMATALRSAGPDHLHRQSPRRSSRQARSASRAADRRRNGCRPRSGSAWAGDSGSAELDAAGSRPAAAGAGRRRRRGCGAVHLRRDRPGEGRGLPAQPAAGPARRVPTACYGIDARRPAGRRLRPVRAVRPGARRRASAVPDMDVTSPGTLTAARARRRGRRDRSHGRLRLPGRAAQRRGHGRRPRPEPAPALGRVRLLMSAGAPVPVALLPRCPARCCRPPSCTRRTG